MKQKKAIYFVLAVLCLIGIAGGIWAWMAYHKTRPNLQSVTAEVQVTAAKLMADFTEDESTANKTYLNKIIEVSGTVASVQQRNGQTIIQLAANADNNANANEQVNESAAESTAASTQTDTAAAAGLDTSVDAGLDANLNPSLNIMGGINCAMHNMATPPDKGDRVTIKGRCTGYLMDVNLVDAVRTN